MSLGGAQAAPGLIINADTGDVLYAEQAVRAWYPASLTKLMTAYVTFQALAEGRLKPTSYLTVSPNAAAQKPSKLGLRAGSKITVDAALHALIIKSANDIAYVLAESVGGSMPKFVARMNSEAKRLGMDGTNFTNPNGLPSPQQVTTARDMAILAQAILRDFPQYEGLFRVEGLQIGKKTLRSYNALIGRYPGAEGMKTGFICASGFNLVASASRGNKRYIAVVLGETGGVKRAERAAELLDMAFDGNLQGMGYAVQALPNTHDMPPDMRDDVCGPNRMVQAAESDETGEAGPYSGEMPESHGYGTQVSGVIMPRNSRLAPKPTQVSAVTISIEGAVKQGPQIAYIDRGNGKPPLPTPQVTPAVQKRAENTPPPKFLPAHPAGKERIEFHGRPKILPSAPIQLQ